MVQYPRKANNNMGRVSAFLGMVLYMYPEKNGRHNLRTYTSFMAMKNAYCPSLREMSLPARFPDGSFAMPRHS